MRTAPAQRRGRKAQSTLNKARFVAPASEVHRQAVVGRLRQRGVEERTIGSWPPPCSLRAGGTVASGHDCDGEGAAEAALLAAVHDDDDNGRFVEIEESYAAGEAAESTTGCTEDARLAALLEDEEHVKEHGRFRSGG